MGPSSSFSCGSLPSVSLEDGLALLDEGGDAFLRIVRHEQPVLELAFQGEARGEGFLDPFHHGTLDQAHRARRAVGEGLRVGHQVLGERLLRVDVVHEADGERLLRGEEPAGDHEVQGPARADEPGEPLGATGAGQDAEGHLGETDLAGARRHHPEVAREGDLEPAAHAVAVDAGDDDLRGAGELVQRLLAVEAEHRLVIGLGALQHLDVRAALKNPERPLVRMMTRASSLNRSSSRATSISAIISRSYVLAFPLANSMIPTWSSTRVRMNLPSMESPRDVGAAELGSPDKGYGGLRGPAAGTGQYLVDRAVRKADVHPAREPEEQSGLDDPRDPPELLLQGGRIVDGTGGREVEDLVAV